MLQQVSFVIGDTQARPGAGGGGHRAGFKGPHAYLSASFCSVGSVFIEHHYTEALQVWEFETG